MGFFDRIFDAAKVLTKDIPVVEDVVEVVTDTAEVVTEPIDEIIEDVTGL